MQKYKDTKIDYIILCRLNDEYIQNGGGIYEFFRNLLAKKSKKPPAITQPVRADEGVPSMETATQEVSDAKRTVKRPTEVTIKSNIPAYDFIRTANPTDYYDFSESKEVLGKGSYGTVVKGIAKNEQRTPVAIKIMRLNEHTAAYAHEEAYILFALKDVCSPYILCIYDYFVHNNKFYMVTELLQDYQGLEIWFSRKSKNENQMCNIITNAMKGLKLIHDNIIVHRDIKPENIMVDIHNQNVKFIDFGTACKEQCLEERDGTILYLSPTYDTDSYEQRDYWALGMTLMDMFFDKRFIYVIFDYFVKNGNGKKDFLDIIIDARNTSIVKSLESIRGTWNKEFLENELIKCKNVEEFVNQIGVSAGENVVRVKNLLSELYKNHHNKSYLVGMANNITQYNIRHFLKFLKNRQINCELFDSLEKNITIEKKGALYNMVAHKIIPLLNTNGRRILHPT